MNFSDKKKKKKWACLSIASMGLVACGGGSADGKTVIVTLHQVDYARRYCPRTVALKQGVVQFDGTTQELSDGFLNQLYGSEMRPEDATPVTNRPVLNPSMAAITQ